MLKVVDKISITAEQARYYLELETKRGGIFIDLDRCLDYQAHYIELIKPELVRWRKMAGIYNLDPDKKDEVRRVFIERFDVDEDRLISKGRPSIAEEILLQIIESGTEDEETEEFIKTYLRISKWYYKLRYLNQYIENPLTVGESYEGHRMVLARPEWKVLSTSRISASKPSVQNIAREFADIITHPPGYLLVRADSGQIEPRITWSHFLPDPVLKRLITIYNDAYMGQLHFITMSNEELKEAYKNPESLQKKELNAEDRQTLKRLGLAGTYGGGLADEDPRLANGYRRMIVEHPLRKQWENDVREAVRNGQETFYGAFGTSVTPDETQVYRKGTPAWFEHLVRCGINNPIQTTASELMCESVYQAKRILATKGHEGSFIGYYKHDEGCFYLEPRDHGLAEELAECLSYDVTLNGERWIPIYSEMTLGKKEADIPQGENPIPVI